MSALTALRAVRANNSRLLKAMRVATVKLAGTRQTDTTLKGSMRLNVRVSLKARATGNGNHAFTGVAYTGGVFYPSLTIGGRAEVGPTVMDLDTITIPSPERPVLDDHDESPDGIIGKTTMFAVRRPQYDLPVKGFIYGTCDRSQKFINAAKGGHNWQLSVGTDGFTVERVPAGQTAKVNGKTFAGPVTVCRNAYLTDVSFVAKGADDLTSATIAARRAKPTRFVKPRNTK